jgi:predicted O-methyltransferase YrrM
MLWHAYALLSHGGDRIGLRMGRRLGSARVSHNPDEVMRVLGSLDEAVWAAQALLVCAETRLLQQLARRRTLDELSQATNLPPALTDALVDVMAGFGFVVRGDKTIEAAPALLPFTSEEGAATFRAGLNASVLQAQDFRTRSACRGITLDGWTHTDAAIIEAQGLLTRMWAAKAAPKLRFLPGLMSSLTAPGARLLDVGAGAAGLAITLCESFPHLTAVALEPAPVPAEIGTRHVAAAGLESRIAIRRERVEDMDDEAAYDLAFLPQMFLPDAIIRETMRRVFSALKPGGWVLVGVLARPGNDAPSAVRRLKNLLWGGNRRDMDAVMTPLMEAGFQPVIRAPGTEAISMICARRPQKRRAS